MRVSIGAVFLCLASLLLTSSILFAQSSEPIHGVVVDPSHAAVPKASVHLIAANGTEAAHTITDQQGRFSFQQHCESCSIEVQLTGFRTTRLPASAETREIE